MINHSTTDLGTSFGFPNPQEWNSTKDGRLHMLHAIQLMTNSAVKKDGF